MKKKIKLRDVTKDEYKEWAKKECKFFSNCCYECPFRYIAGCFAADWLDHREIYSNKILNQEIEIEVPDILDEVEKEYLSAVIKPFRNRAVSISKKIINFENKENKIFYYIRIKIESKTGIFCNEFISLPYFNNEMYKGMKVDKEYTLEELGL